MRRLLLFSLFPCLAWANDESLHFLHLSYGQFSERVNLRNVEYKLLPDSIAAGYTYISPSSWTWRANFWREEAQKTPGESGQIEKQAWGGGISFAYPIADYELELSYSYSRPSFDALGATGDRLEERSKSVEYGFGASHYLVVHHRWSLVPSIQLVYQDRTSEERIQVNNTSQLSDSSESAWLVSSALNLSYLYDINDQASINSFIGVSWSDFFKGKGVTRITAVRRNISLSTTEENKSSSDGSGLVSAGIGLSFDRYQLDLSVDETIDLSSIGTQVNVVFGVLW